MQILDHPSPPFSPFPIGGVRPSTPFSPFGDGRSTASSPLSPFGNGCGSRGASGLALVERCAMTDAHPGWTNRRVDRLYSRPNLFSNAKQRHSTRCWGASAHPSRMRFHAQLPLEPPSNSLPSSHTIREAQLQPMSVHERRAGCLNDRAQLGSEIDVAPFARTRVCAGARAFWRRRLQPNRARSYRNRVSAARTATRMHPRLTAAL
jgi:hypothetical protein